MQTSRQRHGGGASSSNGGDQPIADDIENNLTQQQSPDSAAEQNSRSSSANNATTSNYGKRPLSPKHLQLGLIVFFSLVIFLILVPHLGERSHYKEELSAVPPGQFTARLRNTSNEFSNYYFQKHEALEKALAANTKALLRAPETKKLRNIIVSRFSSTAINALAGIVIYPQAVTWEPIQRPHHFLRWLSSPQAHHNYLSFFITGDSAIPGSTPGDLPILEKFPNVFLVKHTLEAHLLAALMTLSHAGVDYNVPRVIGLCSWVGQMPFLEKVESIFANNNNNNSNSNKPSTKFILWYDVLDDINLFSMSDPVEYRAKHDELVGNPDRGAELVTYSSSDIYRHFVKESFEARRRFKKRGDAAELLYLPNGVNIEDFQQQPPSSGTTTRQQQQQQQQQRWPSDYEKVISDRENLHKPIIGFYGAIEEWVDVEMLEALAQSNPSWNFVLIGRFAKSLSSIEARLSTMPNVFLLGPKPYAELRTYAREFDVALVPFVTSPVTHSVSPVKLFEYAAMGLPVVSTALHEVENYASVQQAKTSANNNNNNNEVMKWLKLIKTQPLDSSSPNERAQAFEAAIREFLSSNKNDDEEDANNRSKMRRSALQFAEKNTWAKRVDNVVEALSKIDKSKRVRSPLAITT